MACDKDNGHLMTFDHETLLQIEAVQSRKGDIQYQAARQCNGLATQKVLRRNERLNVQTVLAKQPTDIFIPAGGRPRTLNETNYKDYLDERGKPTSRAIVEGANLYLTGTARRRLEEAGVLIIKDSSANKGGVITSSFEVLCGLVLTDEEFIALKPQLVAEILAHVQQCALKEARTLLKTHQETGMFTHGNF